MKIILSTVIAALVAMSFSAIVFAADTVNPGAPGAPDAISAPSDTAQKDAKVAKAEAKQPKQR